MVALPAGGIKRILSRCPISQLPGGVGYPVIEKLSTDRKKQTTYFVTDAGPLSLLIRRHCPPGRLIYVISLIVTVFILYDYVIQE
jgi:hypothetical protein